MEDNNWVRYAKCRGTGKVSFPTKLEAQWTMMRHKLSTLVRNKLDGRRVKRRQGKQAQRRIYFCAVCKGYHLTKWTKQNFNNYTRFRDEERF